MSESADLASTDRPVITPAYIEVPVDPDRVVNVHFDDRQIWSFRTARIEGERSGGRVRVSWPEGLRRFLDGKTDVSLVEHGRGVVASAELSFGEGEGRVEIVDGEGRLQIIGPKGRPMLAFGDDAEELGPLLDAALTVLEVLRGCGVEGFLVYGTLLGAIREGSFIGHDNDLDLGYVSEHADPVDVVSESFAIERALVGAGMRVERYSGAGLKVWVLDDAQVARGLDVFGGFWDGPRLALLGEIVQPFERSWMHPLGSARLAGTTFPVPAQPEKLLEVMYGPEWRIPDPTFEFDGGTEGRVRLSRWFRGIRHQRNEWDRYYFHGGSANKRPHHNHHDLADVVAAAEPSATVIDVGCGRGRDVAWLAERGHRAIGLDYSEPAIRYLKAETQASGATASFHVVNLLELRHVLGWGARLSRIEGPRVMTARYLVDSLNQRGRDGLWRLAAMALRGGGRFYLEFLGVESPRARRTDGRFREMAPDAVAAEAAAYGARLLNVEWLPPDRARLPRPTPKWDADARTCRILLEWD